jgi:hypothetical protein
MRLLYPLMVFLAYLAIDIALVLWGAWLTMPVYNWFLVPVGAPQVSVPFYAGMLLIISYFTKNLLSNKDAEMSEIVAFGLVRPPFVLLFGWILVTFFL